MATKTSFTTDMIILGARSESCGGMSRCFRGLWKMKYCSKSPIREAGILNRYPLHACRRFYVTLAFFFFHLFGGQAGQNPTGHRTDGKHCNVPPNFDSVVFRTDNTSAVDLTASQRAISCMKTRPPRLALSRACIQASSCASSSPSRSRTTPQPYWRASRASTPRLDEERDSHVLHNFIRA